MFKGMAAWWQRRMHERRDALMFERQVVVSFDDVGVSAVFRTGEVRKMSWDAVNRVTVETHDGGPFGADVRWILEGADGRVTYPQGATGDSEMLRQFQARFPGFDDSAVIQAMGCTSNAVFVCWERR